MKKKVKSKKEKGKNGFGGEARAAGGLFTFSLFTFYLRFMVEKV